MLGNRLYDCHPGFIPGSSVNDRVLLLDYNIASKNAKVNRL